MNNLHRGIKVGEEVVICADVLKPKYAALEQRVFVCLGGFGMQNYTEGHAIFGKFKSDGEECRMESNWIDVDETIKYQEGLNHADTV